VLAFKKAAILFAALGVFGHGAVGQQATQSKAPVQPLPFNHKTHAATGLKCKECHPNPDPGDHMTLPATARCMACHATIAKEKPAIQKLAEFAKSKEPIPWVRVYSVPAEVYWNHRSHLMAGLECEACHGPVSQMEAMAKVTNVTTMNGCVECHRDKNAGTGCGYCHEEK
jgi:hypothetical protein